MNVIEAVKEYDDYAVSISKDYCNNLLKDNPLTKNKTEIILDFAEYYNTKMYEKGWKLMSIFPEVERDKFYHQSVIVYRNRYKEFKGELSSIK